MGDSGVRCGCSSTAAGRVPLARGAAAGPAAGPGSGPEESTGLGGLAAPGGGVAGGGAPGDCAAGSGAGEWGSRAAGTVPAAVRMALGCVAVRAGSGCGERRRHSRMSSPARAGSADPAVPVPACSAPVFPTPVCSAPVCSAPVCSVPGLCAAVLCGAWGIASPAASVSSSLAQAARVRRKCRSIDSSRLKATSRRTQGSTAMVAAAGLRGICVPVACTASAAATAASSTSVVSQA